MDLNQLTIFFGYCTVINYSILLISFFLILIFKESVMNIHEKLTGVNKEELPTLYFKYLGNMKMVVITLNFTPYIVLKFFAS